ncbi:MAG TPA: hypothetical protein DCR65_10955 [Gammaproteobacteria bacterium]|nr:hypothetical protein [Gammaproteobacteria bacterium]
MLCRSGCGACCIAASIATPFPGMPEGKPAGVPCVHLTSSFACAIYLDPRRPPCCAGLKPATDICGSNREEALRLITALELATRPESAA